MWIHGILGPFSFSSWFACLKLLLKVVVIFHYKAVIPWSLELVEPGFLRVCPRADGDCVLNAPSVEKKFSRSFWCWLFGINQVVFAATFPASESGHGRLPNTGHGEGEQPGDEWDPLRTGPLSAPARTDQGVLKPFKGGHVQMRAWDGLTKNPSQKMEMPYQDVALCWPGVYM